MSACPWLTPLAGTLQEPSYHGEGDVLAHTRMVVEALAGLSERRGLPDSLRGALFLAALLHDIGKPGTTQIGLDGRIGSPGHARAGAAITRSLLWGNTGLGAALPFTERELVVALVRLHGLPLWFLDRPDIAQAVLPASLRVHLRLVALLAEADVRGRICADRAELLDRIALFRDWCAEHRCLDDPYPFPSAHSRVRYCRGLQQDPAYCAYDDTWGEVVVLSGLPGAGKDTWLCQYDSQLPLISLDAIRRAHRVDPEEDQGAVVSAAKAQARELLRRQQPFVWNATNVTRRMRDPLLDLILGYGARVRVVYLDASLATVFRRNQQRFAPVPEPVIRRLASRIEPPDLTEAHRVSYVES
ncbi:MAG: AAA family ATPase [Oscillochloris sp.]|nr:AAA family ATPase [Oscillochloris sp.]